MSALEATRLTPSGLVPATAGIGLRSAHHEQLLAELPPVGWLEVHSENFFAAGGSHLHVLERVRQHYPLSLHGVGLSIGSADRLDSAHLANLRRLITQFEPALVSEHLCWGSIGGSWFNDLLPLPYTEEALQHLDARVSEVQDYLQCQILLENVSSYLRFHASQMQEWEFLGELALRSGCGILLDVNNIYVSSCNQDFDPYRYIAGLPIKPVQEMHLAGYSVNHCDGHDLLLDTHSAPVSDAVWSLYRFACARYQACPTLIEWDVDLPALEVLVAEAQRADQQRESVHVRAA